MLEVDAKLKICPMSMNGTTMRVCLGRQCMAWADDQPPTVECHPNSTHIHALYGYARTEEKARLETYVVMRKPVDQIQGHCGMTGPYYTEQA